MILIIVYVTVEFTVRNSTLSSSSSEFFLGSTTDETSTASVTIMGYDLRLVFRVGSCLRDD